MMGLPFRVNGDGRVLVSWMSRDRAYWSLSDKGTRRFGPKVATPDGGKRDEAFPVAVANPRGEVLFAWVEAGQVRWAIYTEDGKPTDRRGTAGRLPPNTKPTAVLGSGGRFILVF